MENNKVGSCGKRGDKIRSDCYIEIVLKSSGGLNIVINSKVKALFEDNLKEQLTVLSNYFEIKDADILLEDYGALPFVISARFEGALKKIFPDLKKEFLPEMLSQNCYTTKKDTLRRSRLYLPGNEAKFFVNAGLHKPDAIILDLEDSVAPAEKDAALLVVRNALRAVDFYGCERMVRINQLPRGLNELRYLIPHNVNLLLLPKTESAEQVKKVESEILKLKTEFNITNDIWIMPIIESALGVLKSFEIATASNMVCALSVGLEDYTADIGTQRTLEGKESLFARGFILNAAKAASIQAIDTVFSDVSDMDGLRASVLEAKSFGYEGKGCIHPRQIEVVHKAFAPDPAELEKAQKIKDAYDTAIANGSGVVSLGSKMIDAPVVKRALKIIDLNNKLNS